MQSLLARFPVIYCTMHTWQSHTGCWGREPAVASSWDPILPDGSCAVSMYCSCLPCYQVMLACLLPFVQEKCPKVLYEGHKVLVETVFGIPKLRTAPVYILNFFKQKLSHRTVSLDTENTLELSSGKSGSSGILGAWGRKEEDGWWCYVRKFLCELYFIQQIIVQINLLSLPSRCHVASEEG